MKRLAYLVGVSGITLLIGTGCAKTIEGGAGSKSSQQGQTSSLTPGGASSGLTDAGIREQNLSQSGSGGGLPNTGGLGPDSGPLRGFEPVTPGGKAGEEQLASGGSGPMMAKADTGGQPGGALSEQIQREEALTAAAGLQDVFFAFDSWQIPDNGKQALAKNADWLKSNPDKRLRIEGHCDERGTGAYNFELGRKRANAVRNYLIELGATGNQLNMTSYGKTRPFCKDHEEACYQQNRRGHVVVSVK
jgi:peptidoglycan-associated lipoprotein